MFDTEITGASASEYLDSLSEAIKELGLPLFDETEETNDLGRFLEDLTDRIDKERDSFRENFGH